jgi:hypothetical protein
VAKKQPRKVAVGEDWPAGIKIIETQTVYELWKEPKTAIVVSLVILVGFLLVAFTIYGMLRQDNGVLE